MLRQTRVVLATVCFALVTLLFLDFTGTLHAWLGVLAKIQFLPAVLALNVGVIVALVLLTLVLGRVYCSVICPLGVFQDGIARIGRWRKKLPYSYSPARTWLRYGVLVLFIVCLVAGVGAVASLLDPYSAYGRIANTLFAPLWQWGNNLLAYAAERMDSYAFYTTEVWMRSALTLGVAAGTLLIVGILAWRGGRTYCNTICPVGTLLGVISRFSLFKITIDAQRCNGCSLCARKCKASCVDSKAHVIDYSRCVACMNCIDTCKRNAITYRPAWGKKPQAAQEEVPQGGRREFLTVATLLATTSLLKAQEKKVDGGLAKIEEKKVPTRQTRIIPPGTLSAAHMTQHCTACQLCVSACDNKVLRPSTNLDRFMQPEMSFERGYCRPECVKCSSVCPTGAIRPISTAEKSSRQIGHAVWIRANCVAANGVICENCMRHCPTGAIQLVDAGTPDVPKIPVVNEERCIGCGACENLCPANPFSAMYVEGHERHREI